LPTKAHHDQTTSQHLRAAPGGVVGGFDAAPKYALETTASVFVRLISRFHGLPFYLPSWFAGSPRYSLWRGWAAEWLDDTESAHDWDHSRWFWSSGICDRNLLLHPIFPFLHAERAESLVLAIPGTLSGSVQHPSELVVLLRGHQFSLDWHIELSVGSCESTESSLSRSHAGGDALWRLHCCYGLVDCVAYAEIPEKQQMLTVHSMARTKEYHEELSCVS
jgi:hypothetical protein